MEAQYLCPSCQARIPLEDMNVANDIALCRACGRSCAFSVLSGSSRISAETLSGATPRGVRIAADSEDGIEIAYKRLSGVLLFLIPFTAIWSGGSMWGIYLDPLIRKGHVPLESALFGLPFLFGTLVMLSIIAYLTFGGWRIRMKHGRGTVFAGVGPIGWTRRFEYGHDSLVTLRRSGVKVNDVPKDGICVQTGGGAELIFGSLFSEDAKLFIAAAILDAIKGGAGIRSKTSGGSLRAGRSTGMPLMYLLAALLAILCGVAAFFLLGGFKADAKTAKAAATIPAK